MELENFTSLNCDEGLRRLFPIKKATSYLHLHSTSSHLINESLTIMDSVTVHNQPVAG